jgi:multidrug efflux pump subunit AcrA (membrane-fusion protein)
MGAVKKVTKAVGDHFSKAEIKDLKKSGNNAQAIISIAQQQQAQAQAAEAARQAAEAAARQAEQQRQAQEAENARRAQEAENARRAEAARNQASSTPFRSDFNPAAATTTYGFSPDAARLGMSGDFASRLLMPSGNAQLTAAEQDDVRRNIENQFGLYKDQQLTDLRGRISKELAQLYNMTEIGKSKIAAQSAMDVTKETGMQNFRQNVRENYGRSLMNFW